jgi:hypothetical protein
MPPFRARVRCSTSRRPPFSKRPPAFTRYPQKCTVSDDIFDRRTFLRTLITLEILLGSLGRLPFDISQLPTFLVFFNAYLLKTVNYVNLLRLAVSAGFTPAWASR